MPARRSALITLATLVIVAALTIVRAQPPRARGLDASPDVFSAARALEHVRAITASGVPHPVGSPDHRRVRDLLLARLRALEVDPSLDVAMGCSGDGARCRWVENILARIEGDTHTNTLMLAAHYDSVPAGPGAGDDGAGVATILEIVRALKRGPKPERDVLILIDDGEELGLLGARAFVATHTWARDVGVVLNFEARGSRGLTAMFEASEQSATLVEAYGREVSRPTASSLIFFAYKTLPNDTDLTVFKAAGKLGLNFAFADGVWHYHTAQDSIENLDPRSVQHMGDQGLAMARLLASKNAPTVARSHDLIWFDLFGAWLVSYRPIVGKLLAMIALGCALWVLQRDRETKRVAIGLGAIWLAVIAAIASGFLVMLVAGGRAWRTSPLPITIVLWVVAGLVSFVVLHRFRRAAIAHGSMVGWSILSMVTAFFAPGTSYAFTLPAIAMAVALVVRPRVPLVEPLLPAVIGACLWFPLLHVLRVMVGPEAHPASTLSVALLVTLVSPRGTVRAS